MEKGLEPGSIPGRRISRQKINKIKNLAFAFLEYSELDLNATARKINQIKESLSY